MTDEPLLTDETILKIMPTILKALKDPEPVMWHEIPVWDHENDRAISVRISVLVSPRPLSEMHREHTRRLIEYLFGVDEDEGDDDGG